MLSTFALASRNASAPLEARSSFEVSAACAPPEEPYGLEDDGYIDRSVLVILIGSIFSEEFVGQRGARVRSSHLADSQHEFAMCAILTSFLLGAVLDFLKITDHA